MHGGDSTFGRLLLRSRHAAWLTQEELAEKSGLSPRTIQGIERGQVSRPHKESVRLLADALGLDGTERAEFEAAARRDPSTLECPDHRCIPITELVACLRRRLREHGRTVDLDGLGQDADPAAVLARLLRALGIEAEEGIGYGLTGSPVSDHTLPVQALPGA